MPVQHCLVIDCNARTCLDCITCYNGLASIHRYCHLIVHSFCLHYCYVTTQGNIACSASAGFCHLPEARPREAANYMQLAVSLTALHWTQLLPGLQPFQRDSFSFLRPKPTPVASRLSRAMLQSPWGWSHAQPQSTDLTRSILGEVCLARFHPTRRRPGCSGHT